MIPQRQGKYFILLSQAPHRIGSLPAYLPASQCIAFGPESTFLLTSGVSRSKSMGRTGPILYCDTGRLSKLCSARETTHSQSSYTNHSIVQPTSLSLLSRGYLVLARKTWLTLPGTQTSNVRIVRRLANRQCSTVTCTAISTDSLYHPAPTVVSLERR